MITIAPITTPFLAGTPACITVTSNAVPTGEAIINNRTIKGRVAGRNGSYTICFDLRPEERGLISFKVSTTQHATSSIGTVI